MTMTHGDLFREIGELVVSAHAGDTIDLQEKSEELATRYADLGLSPETIAKAIARSVGAVGVSLAIVRPLRPSAKADRAQAAAPGDEATPTASDGREMDGEDSGRSAPGLFPSGLRIALLS